MADADGKNAKRLSNFNTEWIPHGKQYIPEKKNFQTSREKVEYWVMKPADYEPGKKYPLLLEIHGGPTAMWGPGEPTCGMSSSISAARAMVLCIAIPAAVVDMELIYARQCK